MNNILQRTLDLLTQQGKQEAARAMTMLVEHWNEGSHVKNGLDDKNVPRRRFSFNAETNKVHDISRTNAPIVRPSVMLHQMSRWTEWSTPELPQLLRSENIRQQIGEAFGQSLELTESGIQYSIEKDVRKIYAESYLGSCMYQNGQGHPSLKSYNETSNIEIVTVREDGELLGRALLWKAVNGDNELVSVLDRIYPADPNHKGAKLLMKYASDQGWISRVNPTERSSPWPQPMRSIIKMDRNGLPYVDTMSWVIGKYGNLLLMSSERRGRNNVSAQRTDGNGVLNNLDDFEEIELQQVAIKLWGKDHPDVPKIRRAEAGDYIPLQAWYQNLPAYANDPL